MALVKRYRDSVGWMKGHKRQTSLLLCLAVGLTWVDLIMPVFGEILKGEKKSGWTRTEKRGGRSWMNPFCFSFSFFFFFFWIKKKLFLSRLFSFLTAAMCLISYVICSRPRAGTDASAIFTLSLPSSQTQRLAKGTQLRANDQCKKKALTQQKTKRNY